MQSQLAGKGRKRPQINVSIDKIFLDLDNPRFVEYTSEGPKGSDVLTILYKNFNLIELAYSMAENAYLDAEPLVVIPKQLPNDFNTVGHDELDTNDEYQKYIRNPNTEFIVVEGNRRIATIKILLNKDLQQKLKITNWPEIDQEVKEDISLLPAIVYPRREDLQTYLGIRHIIGINKWEPYAKASYIAKLIEEGATIEEIQEKIADRGISTKKYYLCYKLIQIIEEEMDYPYSEARNKFSYLLLALGQNPIRSYLGIKKTLREINIEEPVPKNKIQNLRNLFSFLFGNKKEKKVIEESRDITNKLTFILESPQATNLLIETRNIDDAYDISGGEENLLLKNLREAVKRLQKSLGLISSHKSNLEVKEYVIQCQRIINDISKLLDKKE